MSVNKFAELRNKDTGEVIAQMIGPPNALTSGDALSEGLYALSETIIRGLQPDRDGGGLGGRFGYGAEFENDVFLMHPFCWCESDDCLWCGGSSCEGGYEPEPHRDGCYQVRLRLLAQQYGEPLSDEFPDYYHVPYGSPNTKAYERDKRALCKEFNQDYKCGNEMHCTCGVNAEAKARYDACECDWHTGRGVYRFGKAVDAPHFWHKPSGLQVRWYKWIGRDVEVSNHNLTGAEWHKILLECFESLPEEARTRAIEESEADAKREADPEYQKQQQEAREAFVAAVTEVWETCEREGHDDADGQCSRCGLVTYFEKGFASQN